MFKNYHFFITLKLIFDDNCYVMFIVIVRFKNDTKIFINLIKLFENPLYKVN